MRNTGFDTRSSEWRGDMTVWLHQQAEDNSERLARLHRNLPLAMQQELTERQRQILLLYYHENRTMPEIAQLLGINCSTVSRTLSRARNNLYRHLRYAL